MDLTVETDPACIASLAEEWRALWELDPSATLFQTPEYTSIWLTEFGADRRPFVVQGRRDGRLVGLATLSIDSDGVLRFLGDPELTDYFGPVATPEDREEFTTELLLAASRDTSWGIAELFGLAGDAGWAEVIARAAKGAGFAVDEEAQVVCPRIALGGSFDDYLASLDGKLRHEIRRKARKLEREGGTYSVRLVQDPEVHDDMERFFDMFRAAEGPKGHFAHWGLAGFFILLARTFASNGWLRLTFLQLDGRDVAGVFSFAARGTWYVYNAAFDPGYRELAPGMVLMADTIKLATEENCHTFDLMRGDEPYKYRFGATDMPLSKLTIRRN